jgi:hypothetical protein
MSFQDLSKTIDTSKIINSTSEIAKNLPKSAQEAIDGLNLPNAVEKLKEMGLDASSLNMDAVAGFIKDAKSILKKSGIDSIPALNSIISSDTNDPGCSVLAKGLNKKLGIETSILEFSKTINNNSIQLYKAILMNNFPIKKFLFNLDNNIRIKSLLFKL